MLMTPIRPYVIARPRATRSSTEPRLMPVKTTARRSPQARRERTDDSACCSATRTSASLSPSGARRPAAGSRPRSGCCSPARRRRQALARSDDETRIVARMRSSWRFDPRHRSRPRTPSRPAAATIRRAMPWRARRRRRGGRRRRREHAQAGERGLERAARPVVAGDVLGASGSVRGAPLAASVALPSWTMKTLSPATLTSSSSIACRRRRGARRRARPPR